MEQKVDIMKLIPTGHANAISRAKLQRLAGLSDRSVREMIHAARRDYPILNMQDGSGYFLPDPEDPEDLIMLKSYCEQEVSRAKTLLWSLKSAKDMLRKKGEDVSEYEQLSFSL